MGLWYSKDTGITITTYANADHVGCQDTRRSTSGSAQFLGDKLVSWSSKKQKSTAISSTEAKYIALSRSKHIDVRYHFIKEQVENRVLELYFVRIEYQLADIFTKALPQERFNFLINKLGMKSIIMKQDKAQEAARDEKLVPTKDRVKIGSSNLKIDPTITQKEETYQVVLDIIKDSSYYNAFLITVDVPEIYMQQFWFTITKVKKSSFYQFKLDNKKCQIDVELFQEILGISPRVPNQEFTMPSSYGSLMAFLMELGYKGQMKQLLDMFVDHMHQP
ncbi:hypothetical protein Tco_1202526 [Tanacetum coccineum]